MADTIDVEFAHHYRRGDRDYVPGETAAFDADVAAALVRGGIANYVRKTDAVVVEGEAGAEKTARARKRGAAS